MAQTKRIFEEIRERINEQVNRVIEGELNPLELGRELSYTKNCIEAAKEEISADEKAELEKYTPDELKEMKVQLAGGGYTYKFDHIPEWVEKKSELSAIEEKAKSALKAIEKNSTFFDNETGSEVTPAVANPRKQNVSYK